MFMILCDLLVVFSEQTEDDPSVDLPVYKPDMFMYENILRFMETFVFSKTGTNGAEDDEEAKVAAARMRRNCAARYCNLFTSGALPFKLASVLFEHYPKPSGEGDIGDIIKETLDSLRKADVIHFARAMAVGLTDMFRTLPRDSNGRIDVSTEQFACIKVCFPLCRVCCCCINARFILSLGFGQEDGSIIWHGPGENSQGCLPFAWRRT